MAPNTSTTTATAPAPVPAQQEITETHPVTNTFDQDPAKVTTVLKPVAVAGVEYASSRPRDLILGMVKALPEYVDDVTRDFGPDLYERMMLDPQVASVVDILRMAALYNGFQLGVHQDVPEADKEQAQKITDFCQWNLDNLATPFEQVLYELSAGVYLGHKVAEQVYRVDDRGEGDGPQLVVDDIHPKPYNATAFVVDDKNNELGLIPTIPGRYAVSNTYLPVGADGQIEGLVPRSKFVVFTNEPKDRDPRGTSVLRNVYTEWWMKQQLKPEYLQFLATQAVPSVIGELPENATPVDQLDEEGVPTGNKLDPADQMNAALEGIRNGGTLVHPHGGRAYILQTVVNDGTVFITAFDFLNGQIAKGVTKQTLATEEAKHMARAASVTHQDVLAFPTERITQNMAQTIRADILKPLVLYNYGEDAARRFTPDVQSAEVDQQDFATAAHGFAELLSSGALDKENYDQISWMLETLGAPPLDADLFKQKLAEKQMQADALAAQMQGQGAPQDGAQGQGQDQSGQGGQDGGQGQAQGQQSPQPGVQQPPTANGGTSK
jgi:hypothetical protein